MAYETRRLAFRVSNLHSNRVFWLGRGFYMYILLIPLHIWNRSVLRSVCREFYRTHHMRIRCNKVRLEHRRMQRSPCAGFAVAGIVMSKDLFQT